MDALYCSIYPDIDDFRSIYLRFISLLTQTFHFSAIDSDSINTKETLTTAILSPRKSALGCLSGNVNGFCPFGDLVTIV